MNVREIGTKLTSSTDATSVNTLNTNGKTNSKSTSNHKNSKNNKCNSLVDSVDIGDVDCTTNKSTSNKSSSFKNKNSTKNSSLKNSNSSTTNHSVTKEEVSKIRKKSIKATNSKKLKKEQLEPNLQFDHQQSFTQSNKQIDSTYFDSQQSVINSNSSIMSSSSSNQQTNQDGWYLKEIQNMMHGFGDSPNANPESVRLIEQIVHQQITCLLRLACDIAIQRQSKQIGLEDFLFLLRKDKIKLCRLLRHFNLKDMRNRMTAEQWSDTEDQTTALDASCTIDFDEEELLNALILEQKTNQTQDTFYSSTVVKQQSTATENVQTATTSSNRATVFPQPAKRLKLCLDFLASIDQTGELDRYLQEDQFYDELKQNRMMRIERMTRLMSEKEYLDFYKARQTSFANRLQPNKFRDWLYNVSFNQLDANQWPIKPNALAIEILQFFAYETVAILVDLALLVKQDQEKHSFDPVSKLISINSHSNAFPQLSSNDNLTFSGSMTNQLSNYASSSNNSNHTNLTNLLNPSTFSNCSLSLDTGNRIASQTTSLNTATSLNKDNQQKPTKNTILPSPFLFASANTQNKCPFFSIKPQEIREVIRRYINCNPRGTLSSVLLFGSEQWNQPLIASRSKVICL